MRINRPIEKKKPMGMKRKTEMKSIMGRKARAMNVGRITQSMADFLKVDADSNEIIRSI